MLSLGKREMSSGLAMNELDASSVEELLARAGSGARRSSAPAMIGLGVAIVIECAWVSLLFLVAARLVLA